MGWSLAYEVSFGDLTGFTDITADVLSLSTDVQITIGEFARSICTLKINNNDGKYTPGGTGIYSEVDFYSKLISIQATLTGTTGYVFYGIIDRMEIERISVNESIVTITALDPISVAGRSTITQPAPGYLYYADDGLSKMINGDTDGSTVIFQEVAFPTFASISDTKADIVSSLISAPTTDLTTVYTNLISAGTVGDKINNALLPTGPLVAWADIIYTATQPKMNLAILAMDYCMSRADINAYYLDFLIPWDDTYQLTHIPVISFQEGFNKDELCNSCAASSADDTVTSSVTNDGSINLYGMRNKTFSGLASEDPVRIQRVAEFWANRFSTVRYGFSTITTSYKTAQINTLNYIEYEFGRLLWPTTVLMNEIRIHKDSSMNNFDRYVVLGRRLDANPTDTKITLTLGWFFDYTSVVLEGGTRVGTSNVLAGGGYDDAATTYNNANVDYNSAPPTGSRLA